MVLQDLLDRRPAKSVFSDELTGGFHFLVQVTLGNIGGAGHIKKPPDGLDQPDGVPGVASVRRPVGLEDEFDLQVARVVVSGGEVGNDPRWEAEAAQDCGDMKHLNSIGPFAH